MRLNYEIPDGLHRSLKIAAAMKGMTLKDLVIAYLLMGLEDEDIPPINEKSA